MSIETAIAENTAAIHALIASNASLLALRTEAIEKVGAAVGKTTAAKDKPAAEKKSDDPKGAISTDPENRVNPYEGIKDTIAGYLGEIDRPEEREARKDKIKALLNHEKIKKAGVENATKADDIREDAIQLFKDQVAKLTAKGALTEPAKPASDDLV